MQIAYEMLFFVFHSFQLQPAPFEAETETVDFRTAQLEDAVHKAALIDDEVSLAAD